MSVWLYHSKRIASSHWGFQELGRDHRIPSMRVSTMWTIISIYMKQKSFPKIISVLSNSVLE